MKKAYLFVCYQNESRSPAAADVFDEILKENNVEGIIESAGYSEHARNHLTLEHIQRADVVFALDKEVMDHIQKNYPPVKRLINLDIPDVYFFGKIDDFLLNSEIKCIRIMHGEKAVNNFMARTEIQQRMSLYRVLRSRNLAQYI
jgi:predicted protein tyrosine phosphatase